MKYIKQLFAGGEKFRANEKSLGMLYSLMKYNLCKK